MIFNSVTYLLFLVVVTTSYWVLSRRLRLGLIFLSSLTFYGFWHVEYIPVLLISIAVNYGAAIGIERSVRPWERRALLVGSLAVNLGLLGYFKYLNFFADSVSEAAQVLGLELSVPVFKFLLPLGISFYTFHNISYTVDVYRGFIRSERNFVLFGSYVVFFPQLVAGPILRAAEVIPQLAQRPRFDFNDIGIGLRRIFIGMFLKVVMADNIGILVDTGFASPVSTLSAIDVWTLAFLFGFQIYFDFSAYSHIAIGSARLMGIRFPENFNFPYMANSPREFWKRWHISLSSWIRDYLYLPLTGERVLDRSTGGLGAAAKTPRTGRQTRALFITWALMGLWHGASWNFVLWGLWHALLIMAYRVFSPVTKGVSPTLQQVGGWMITLPLIMLSWILFRADSLSVALGMLESLLHPYAYFWYGMRENAYFVAAALMLAVAMVYIVNIKIRPWLSQYRMPMFVAESAVWSVIIALVFVFLRPIKQYIYFQF
jgi:D-alanyl-lipoteichoic acid acyltransferase DltB (MBOAT superfamily)